MSVLSMEVSGVGRNAQQQGMNTTALIQGLRSYIANTDGSQANWNGAGGAAYMRARANLMEKMDQFAGTQGNIGLGTQHTVQTTARQDEDAYTDMSGASGEIGGINAVTPVGV